MCLRYGSKWLRVITVGIYQYKDLNERSPFLKVYIFRDITNTPNECTYNAN